MPIFWGQLAIIGLIAGLSGGLFGLGGGAILVPAMALGLGIDQKLATGTSLAAQVLPIGILGALVYYRNGNLDLRYAGLLALTMVGGNFLGALFANQPYISSDLMKQLYGVFLVAIGLRYLVVR